MTYRDRIFALAARQTLGGAADGVLTLLPADRREAVAEAMECPDEPGVRLAQAARREARRVNAWGRRRWGPAWDQLDPRVQMWLIEAQRVKQHG